MWDGWGVMLTPSTQYSIVWNQTKIPVVWRRDGKGESIVLKLPFSTSNRLWLKGGRRIDPKWIGHLKQWEIPKAWFNDFIERALDRYGLVYVIQPYNVMEKCAPACLNAIGHECQCSCMGQNHGIGNDGSWFEIGEAFAFRYDDRHLACRLIKRK